MCRKKRPTKSEIFNRKSNDKIIGYLYAWERLSEDISFRRFYNKLTLLKRELRESSFKNNLKKWRAYNVNDLKKLFLLVLVYLNLSPLFSFYKEFL